MFYELNCLIGLTNSDNLVIFEIREFQELKKNSNARKFINSYNFGKAMKLVVR